MTHEVHIQPGENHRDFHLLSNFANVSENQMGSNTNVKIGLILCRICGRSHDLASPHIYDYTQVVDADLCCTVRNLYSCIKYICYNILSYLLFIFKQSNFLH